MLKSINLRGKKLNLPAFFPDATYGKVKGAESKELLKIETNGVVVNIYHLLKYNLINKIEKAGGIHKYMKLNLPIISDSGGFQVFSLIHRNPELGKIDDDRVVFLLDGKKIIMTPESCIDLQLKIGSDIIMCLDDCRHVEQAGMKKSVKRTIEWARRCKKEFEKKIKKMKNKPLLFGIVQGGQDKRLRKYCAQELVKIGFDGYAYGGWPMKQGKLLTEILKYTANLLPDDKPKYAMGVGKPVDIVKCCKLGYNLFDCVLPTRDARHKRVFLGNKEINIRKKYFSEKTRVEGKTIKQLYELFKTNREKAIHLATIHNLREYARLMQKIRRFSASQISKKI